MKNAQPKLARIDSHQHFWQRSRGDHWLTPGIDPIYQDFLPHDLHPELITAKIDKTVLIQAASTEAETNFMLNLAEKTNFTAGVIGWVDMESQDVSHKLNRLAQNPLFKGISELGIGNLRFYFKAGSQRPSIYLVRNSTFFLLALKTLIHLNFIRLEHL